MVVADILQLAVCTGSGVVFGFAAEKALVYSPSILINQMTFSQFTMLKMFLSAVISGVGVFSLLYALPATHNKFNTVRQHFSGGLSSYTCLSSVLGGAILGMGITLSGSCPGMVFVQIGTGTQNALLTLAGCFTGALLYSVVDGYILRRVSVPHYTVCQESFMDKRLGVSFTSLAIPFALLLVTVVMSAEYFFPWTSEVPVSPAGVPFLQQRSWSPILSGLIVGSLQLPLSLTVGDSLGGSSSYCCVLAQLMSTLRVLETRPFLYLSRFKHGVGNWWQVLYWGGAIMGGALGIYSSGTLPTTVGVAPLTAFTGGVCLVFGARLASGCTSGHGLSGMGLLSISSFLTVAAMFTGGISLAVTMKYF